MSRREGHSAVLLATIVLLWAGMVLGISFLEAWVKFRAPSLSLEEGLDVGRHVFGALHVVEVVAALVVGGLLVAGRPPRPVVVALGLAVAVVALQAVWLLPALDRRVELILAGGDPPAAPYHVLYVALEAVKVAALVLGGVRCLLPGGAPSARPTAARLRAATATAGARSRRPPPGRPRPPR